MINNLVDCYETFRIYHSNQKCTLNHVLVHMNVELNVPYVLFQNLM